MPTKKIRELPQICRHPEHNPPSHQVFEPGIWQHVCPACGKTTTFRVDKPMLKVDIGRRCQYHYKMPV